MEALNVCIYQDLIDNTAVGAAAPRFSRIELRDIKRNDVPSTIHQFFKTLQFNRGQISSK